MQQKSINPMNANQQQKSLKLLDYLLDNSPTNQLAASQVAD